MRQPLLGSDKLAGALPACAPEPSLRPLALGLGAYALVGGVVTLLGWAFDFYRLTDWGAKGISMKPNAAIAAVAMGAAVILLSRRPARIREDIIRGLAFIAASVGGLTLLEHISGWDFGIDNLLFEEAPGARATAAPGRMGVLASTSFLLMGVACSLCTAPKIWHRGGVALGLIVIGMASLPLSGYLYGADQMYALPRLTGISMQMASMLLALGLGLVVSFPECQPLRRMLDRGAAGLLVRRVLPFLIVVPFALGGIRVWVQQQGLVDTAFGTALRTLAEVMLLIGLIWWAAGSVKAHENALAESRDRLRSMVESITDGFIALDQEWRITYVNARAEVFIEPLRKTVDSLMGRVICEEFADISGTEFESNCRHAVKARVMVSFTAFYPPLQRWFDVRANPSRDGLSLYFVDVTDLRLAQDQLREAQRDLEAHARALEGCVAERTAELRATNDQLEAFVYSIAHDLRAPLRSMTGFSQLLLEQHVAELSPAGQRYLQRIQTASEFMDKLLLDLLDYSRASRAEMVLARVPVRHAWEAACLQLAESVERTRACIEIVDPLPEVLGHEAMLTQSLANLLSNALKFVAPGVTPSIRFRAEQRPTGLAGGACVRLWVEDNGIGIAAEHQERAFRVFERLNGSCYPGTGIGLAIVRKGIERMGGSVGLESAPGAGSNFWIDLRKF